VLDRFKQIYFAVNRLSWRVKLIALYTFVLLASLLIQLVYIVPWLDDRELSLAQSHQQTIAQNIATELDLNLKDTRSILLDMAKWPEFQTMNQDSQMSLLSQYAETIPKVSMLAVINMNGFYYASSAITIVGTRSTYAGDIPTSAGTVFFSSPHYSQPLSTVTTFMLTPLFDEDGNQIGGLMAGLDLGSIIKTIQNYPVGKGSQAYLIDRTGIVVAHSGINMQDLPGGPLSLSYYDRDIVQTVKKYNVQFENLNGSQYYTYKSVRYFGTYSILESNGWSIIVDTPVQIIMSDANTLRQNLLIINIAIFVIAIAITIIFTNQIAKYQKKTDQTLLKYRDHLEELVASRTEELAKTNEQLKTEVNKNDEANKQIQTLFEEEKGLRQALERQISRRAKFTRMLVHELKTPLTALMASSDLLMENANTDRLKRISNQVNLGALSLDKRVSELFDLTKGEIGILNLRCANISVAKLLDDVYAYYSSEALKKRIDFNREYLNDLPIAWADSERLTQVLNNLLDNAFKFTPAGGKIELRASTVNHDIIIEVRDSGCGISQEKLNDLFQPYEGQKNSGANFEGMGLGLSLSRILVELHGGKIRVQSREGAGSTFSFSLPIVFHGE
jgi:signal transduction histidine kinase